MIRAARHAHAAFLDLLTRKEYRTVPFAWAKVGKETSEKKKTHVEDALARIVIFDFKLDEVDAVRVGAEGAEETCGVERGRVDGRKKTSQCACGG